MQDMVNGDEPYGPQAYRSSSLACGRIWKTRYGESGRWLRGAQPRQQGLLRESLAQFWTSVDQMFLSPHSERMLRRAT